MRVKGHCHQCANCTIDQGVGFTSTPELICTASGQRKGYLGYCDEYINGAPRNAVKITPIDYIYPAIHGDQPERQ